MMRGSFASSSGGVVFPPGTYMASILWKPGIENGMFAYMETNLKENLDVDMCIAWNLNLSSPLHRMIWFMLGIEHVHGSWVGCQSVNFIFFRKQ